MTELEAINKMLRFVGELPVPSSVIIADLPDGHEAKTALEILDETNRELQETSWWFNTEELTYTPVADVIAIPSTVVAIQNTTRTKYINKEGYLYDVTNGTGTFTTALDLVTVSEISFIYTPLVFQNLVVYQASSYLHDYLNGDSNIQQRLDSYIYKQYLKVQKEHMSNKDYNLIRGTRLLDRGSNPIPLV